MSVSPALRKTVAFGVLAGALVTAASAALRESADSFPIEVTERAGTVSVSMGGQRLDGAEAGSTLLLPARVMTGEDGRFGIAQGATSVLIAPSSDIEIPAAAARGQLVARMIQHRGHAFYDVETREVGRLRVETPLLVAVVKGTQFNVSVSPQTVTIALFEGQLEIFDPDGGDRAVLEGGEIAIRSLTEDRVRILSMDANLNEDASIELEANVAGLPLDVANDAEMVNEEIVSALDLGAAVGAMDTGFAGGATADLQFDTDADLGGGSADLGLDAGADLGGTSADLGLDADADLGGGSADLGLDADAGLGGTSADLGLDADADLGGTSADLGLDADADLGAGLDGDGGGLELDAEVGIGGEDGGLETDFEGDTEGDMLDLLPEEDGGGGLLNGLL